MTGMVAAVVVAAGRGERAGGDVPKQYREIAGEPMIRSTLRAFLDHPQIALVQPVIHPDDEDAYRAATADSKNWRRRSRAARRARDRCAPGSKR